MLYIFQDENVIVDMETGEVRLVDFGAADYLERAKHREFQGRNTHVTWCKRFCVTIFSSGNNPIIF